MPDNSISVGGHAVSSRDRSGVQWQRMLDGNAVSAVVLVVTVTTTSSSAAIAADGTSRRQMSIQNTGASTVEISPTPSFVWGTGIRLVAGSVFGINYSGAIYALVASDTGELRAWSED